MSIQHFIARILTRFLACLPVSSRYEILTKMFRHSATDSLDIVTADRNKDVSEKWLKEFFDELLTIVKRLGASVNPEKGSRSVVLILKSLLELDNQLYKTISLNALKYDDGLHPKHRLMGYHDFFCKNVGPEESVLDIGCGNGFLTSDVAKCTSGRVVGIDMDKNNIEFAKTHYQADNIEFIFGNVKADIEHSHFDVVIMSNVLEHLTNRVEFLTQVREMVWPAKFLIRVPMYEREWMVPLKEELGIEYMLDAGHAIEYTQERLFEEFSAAGLNPEKWEIRWGEIWCRAVPENDFGSES